MELKGAFKYLIQVVSDYINDQTLLSQLVQLQSLLEDKYIKDIELKRFILSMKTQVQIIGKQQNPSHCKTNSLHENLNFSSNVKTQKILQPLCLNTGIKLNHEISTPRPHKCENKLFQGSKSERNQDEHFNVKNQTHTEFINLQRNPISAENFQKSSLISVGSNKINLLQLTKFTIQDFNNNTIELIQKISDKTKINNVNVKKQNLFQSRGKQTFTAMVR